MNTYYGILLDNMDAGTSQHPYKEGIIIDITVLEKINRVFNVNTLDDIQEGVKINRTLYGEIIDIFTYGDKNSIKYGYVIDDYMNETNKISVIKQISIISDQFYEGTMSKKIVDGVILDIFSAVGDRSHTGEGTILETQLIETSKQLNEINISMVDAFILAERKPKAINGILIDLYSVEKEKQSGSDGDIPIIVLETAVATKAQTVKDGILLDFIPITKLVDSANGTIKQVQLLEYGPGYGVRSNMRDGILMEAFGEYYGGKRDYTINRPPTISNISIKLPSSHKEPVNISAIIDDINEDLVNYRVLVNGKTISEWSDMMKPPVSISIDVDPVNFKSGTNAISIEATDGASHSIPNIQYITYLNASPTVIGTLLGRRLIATIDDKDGDPIKYRIKLNNNIKQDWTSISDLPTNVSYLVNREDIIIDKTNLLSIEVEDSFGGINSCDFDFIGGYYGIMFMNEFGEYYSDDKGNILKKFHLGHFNIRKNKRDIKMIKVKNTTGMDLNNIKISYEPKDLNVDIKLSLEPDGSNYFDTITIPIILKHNDIYNIYVKIECNSDENIGDNSLDLIATGEIIEQ